MYHHVGTEDPYTASLPQTALVLVSNFLLTMYAVVAPGRVTVSRKVFFRFTQADGNCEWARPATCVILDDVMRVVVAACTDSTGYNTYLGR